MPGKQSCAKPGEKLLALYTLLMLRAPRAISLSELAQALECSKQTVLRLLVQLEASGYGKLDAPIVQGREHCYRITTVRSRQMITGCFHNYFFSYVVVDSGGRPDLLFRRDSR